METLQTPINFYDIILEEPYLFPITDSLVITAGYIDLDGEQPSFWGKTWLYLSKVAPYVAYFIPVIGKVFTITYGGYKLYSYVQFVRETRSAEKVLQEAEKEAKRAYMLERARYKESLNSEQINQFISPEQRKAKERELLEQDLLRPYRLTVLLLDNDKTTHHWHLIIPSLDPELILMVVRDVMESGIPTFGEDKKTYMAKEINGYTVHVRYETVNGLRRVRDAYVCGRREP